MNHVRRDRKRSSGKFMRLNVLSFTALLLLIAAAVTWIVAGVIRDMSAVYARFYALETVEKLESRLSRETSLVESVARSRAVTQWLADEGDSAKRGAAYHEIMDYVDIFPDNFFYLVVADSLSEYAVSEGVPLPEFQPFSTMSPENGHDRWYFECVQSVKPYLLNMDVDKITKTKRVWINYKVTSGGETLGAFGSALDLDEAFASLFDEYDVASVMGMVVDSEGTVLFSSADEANPASYADVAEFDAAPAVSIGDVNREPIFLAALDDSRAEAEAGNEEPRVVRLVSEAYRFASIAPITDTDWTVVTFFNASSLFEANRFLPLIVVLLLAFLIYAAFSSRLLRRLSVYNTELALERYKTERLAERSEMLGSIVELRNKAEEQSSAIMAGIDYASKIQENLLPPESAMAEAFRDHAVIWKPRDIVGGDIYWMKRFSAGTVLAVADCTGHGTPGALITMLVVSALEAAVTEENAADPAAVIFELDRRLGETFSVWAEDRASGSGGVRNGCDLVVLFVDGGGAVSLSAGNMNVYLSDGESSTRIRGQRLFVGEGRIPDKGSVKTTRIPAKEGTRFYVATDGLFDQNSDETDEPFGYAPLGDLILEHHGKPLQKVLDEVWAAFEAHRGTAPRVDDFEMVAFEPRGGTHERA